ncbi:MAG: hypothetical protein ACR2GH_00985 [Pseudonocardia sp.]
MKSEYPSPEQVLDDLGDKVAQGLALMVGRTRTDLETYRRTFPAWVADSTDRGLLNWCHDRAWVHALRIFDGVPEVSSVDQPPTRELYVGTRYRLRVKKHDVEGGVSTFLTQGALDFLEQEPVTLDGLEEIRLIAGYRWDPERRELGAAVISLRDGHDHVIWMYELDEPAGGVGTTTTPILSPTEPSVPEIEMPSDGEHGKAAKGTEGR